MGSDTDTQFPLSPVPDTGKHFLAGRRNRSADLESAGRLFVGFLRSFEQLDCAGPCG